MNFKDWKLISQDGQKAKLKHANGHEMTLAMKAIPKIQREQIMRLAKANEYKDGGEVKHYADADGQDSDVQSDSQPTKTPTVIVNNNPNPTNPVATVANTVPTSLPTVSPNTGPSQGTVNQGGQPNPSGIIQTALAGAAGQRDVDIANAKAQIPVEQGMATGLANSANPTLNAQNAEQSLAHELFGNVASDVAINPHRYQDQLSAPENIAHGLGIILSGAGSHATGGRNLALDYINNQIDRDIDAQKSTFANKRSVLSAYHDLFGDSFATTNMTQATMQEVYKNLLKNIALQRGTPQAYAAYNKAAADITNDQALKVKNSAVDLSGVPGNNPVYRETGAQNVPRGTSPNPIAQQPAGGMTTADLQKLHDEQTGAVSAGIPSSKEVGNEESKKETAEDVAKELKQEPIEPILSPNAERIYQNALNYNPGATKQGEAMQQQYKTAKLADEQLKNVNKNYAQLIDLAGKGGVMGRIHRTFEPEDVPSGGGDLVSGLIRGGSKAISGFANTSTNRLYDAASQNLTGALTSILRGQVNDSTIHDIVRKVSPEYGDTPGDLREKAKILADFIKIHVPTDALHPFGISNR